MKIFLSWSGVTSGKIAKVFHDWIKDVIQSAKPFYSPVDIAKGEVSLTVLAEELEGSSFGVLFLTPENVNNIWIMYEAGALSKMKSIAKVCPLLFELRNSDLTGPLAQFQATDFSKDEVFHVVQGINLANQNSLDVIQLRKSFETHWPYLDREVHKILADQEDPATIKARSQNEILEEILQLVRNTNLQTTAKDIFSDPGSEQLLHLIQLCEDFDLVMQKSKEFRNHEMTKRVKYCAGTLLSIIRHLEPTSHVRQEYASRFEDFIAYSQQYR